MESRIQALNESINNWLQLNGFECSAEYGNTFNYDYQTKMISYTTQNIEQDSLFLEICRSIYCDIDKYDLFIIYFFHELGYNMTQHYITKVDIKENQKLKEIECPTEDQKLAYFVSFVEWEATSWACNYIKNNASKIAEFYNIINIVNTN